MTEVEYLKQLISKLNPPSSVFPIMTTPIGDVSKKELAALAIDLIDIITGVGSTIQARIKELENESTGEI